MSDRRPPDEIVPLPARTVGGCMILVWILVLAVGVPLGIAVGGPAGLATGALVAQVCGCPGAGLVVVAVVIAWLYYGWIKPVWT